MFGKLYGSMFDGSLYGKGWAPLLVMSYVVANAQPDREVGMIVELNPKALADKFGEEEGPVRKAIEFLCSPDPDSTTPDEEGRRLIRLGAFSYQVVNGAKYRAMRDEEDRRRQVREAMSRYRAKKRGKIVKPGRPTSGEVTFTKAEANGTPQDVLDKLSESNAPPVVLGEVADDQQGIVLGEAAHE